MVYLLAEMRGEEPWQLTGDQSTKQRFENSRTGYRIATSVDGVATGEGGDRVVCDDPHNAQEVQSDVTRESVLKWWNGTMSSRLNDPKTGAFVIVMQRLHERDLTGHLVERDGYTHSAFRPSTSPHTPSSGQTTREPSPASSCGPRRFAREALDELKLSMGSYGAAGQLQQRPAPDELCRRSESRTQTPTRRRSLPLPWCVAQGVTSTNAAFEGRAALGSPFLLGDDTPGPAGKSAVSLKRKTRHGAGPGLSIDALAADLLAGVD